MIFWWNKISVHKMVKIIKFSNYSRQNIESHFRFYIIPRCLRRIPTDPLSTFLSRKLLKGTKFSPMSRSNFSPLKKLSEAFIDVISSPNISWSHTNVQSTHRRSWQFRWLGFRHNNTASLSYNNSCSFFLVQIRRNSWNLKRKFPWVF